MASLAGSRTLISRGNNRIEHQPRAPPGRARQASTQDHSRAVS